MYFPVILFRTMDPIPRYKDKHLNNLQISNNSCNQGIIKLSTTLQQLAYGAINLRIAYVILAVDRL